MGSGGLVGCIAGALPPGPAGPPSPCEGEAEAARWGPIPGDKMDVQYAPFVYVLFRPVSRGLNLPFPICHLIKKTLAFSRTMAYTIVNALMEHSKFPIIPAKERAAAG